MADTPPPPPSFAKQLERLEEIVRRLESQELDLDDSLKLFEEGVERLRVMRERLTATEATVKRVLRREDTGGE
ncbi:MAG TPA: exodeoxyribonuclease VII small subunit [Gemmatimonadales bacterium]|nr:exodeoxyribonuclease VII small subunit [Gemmatimonadales bacterium]